MSITSALNNALSGLNATTRQAELISNNVANALTPGYSRQIMDLSSNVVNGNGLGVTVSAVRIVEDPVTTASRRLADAAAGEAQVRTTAQTRLADQLGNPGSPNALAQQVARFETALAAAATDPSSSSLQRDVVDAAVTVTRTMNQISTENRRIRMDADAAIQREVGEVNSALQQIGSLNREIQMRTSAGKDVASLLDQRKRLIDRISSIIPIKTARRDDDSIAIYSAGGQTLLDGRAATLEFTPSGIITPDMTVGNGALSGLSVNGNQITMGEGGGLLDGGSLAAHFETRDITVPGHDQQLDAFAADIISRFQDPAVDPTLGAGDAGLFTDNGNAYLPANEQGLAYRIGVNAAVDPRQGGDLWRLRDGINAAAQGNVGSTTLLDALKDAATGPRTPSASLGISTAMGMSGFAAELTSQRATEAVHAGDHLTTARTVQDNLVAHESQSTGVRTDEEMQRLLLVEQAFAANARVISAADEMIQQILEI